jgi:acyl-CoA synthetase (NDP forming)
MSLAQALFAPRSVALVGASGDAAKNTARPQRYLRKHGYPGKLFPVNPTRKEILGEKAYARVSDIAETVDHAYILIEDVEQALEDCGRRGVPVASVFSGGFSDAGPKGVRRQAELVARARSLGVRLLGPNSMGVIDVPGRLALSVNAVLEMDVRPGGTTSIVSQSGTMLGTLLSRGAARGLGFAKLVSVGNEADLGVGELVELLVADAGTRVILLFLETVRDAERLARAVRAAHAAGKSVVAYKLGRSALGEAAALSHTGALAGTDPALDAYFRDCGTFASTCWKRCLKFRPYFPKERCWTGRVSRDHHRRSGERADRLGCAASRLPRRSWTHDGRERAEPRRGVEKASASECDPWSPAGLGAVSSELAVQPIIQ